MTRELCPKCSSPTLTAEYARNMFVAYPAALAGVQPKVAAVERAIYDLECMRCGWNIMTYRDGDELVELRVNGA